MRQPNGAFWAGKSVVVTGGAGFVGGALVRDLKQVGAEVRVVRSAQHDLRDPAAARAALDGAQYVFHLAANVGGIGYNRRNPAPLVYDNMVMAANVFEQARQAGVSKLVSACTVCAYPKFTPTPFSEDELWNGYPEETNAPYGLAKKMMIVLSDAYRRQYEFDSVVPMVVNLYGPRDHFSLEDSHVIPAMIRKFHEAVVDGLEEVVMWGSGKPSREFLYVDDAARALALAAEHLQTSEPVNVGTGLETSIAELAHTIARHTGFEGRIEWDTSKPDGQPSRCLDVSRAREQMGFAAEIDLEEGLRRTVEWYREHVADEELQASRAEATGSPSRA
ncbi:MAG: GDP-L-fucose synthase [Actinobacteria bacterium]|nr:MAG: GDP-L-fucose synthase [Actinomycetota bacterium]